MTDLTGLQEAWATYRDARLSLFGTMSIPQSCRDPLSEFAKSS